MAALILPSRRFVQPQGAVEVDWSNKFGQSILTGFNGAVYLSDTVGHALSATSGVSQTPNNFAFAGTAGNRVQYATLPVIGQTFTVLCRARFDITTNHGSVLDNKRDADWTTTKGFELNAREAGGILFKVGSSESFTDTNYLKNSSFHTVAAVFRAGTQQSIYVDGVEIAYSIHDIASAYIETTTPLISGAYYDLSSLRTFKGEINYLYLFAEAFSLAEVADLMANPWQIFKPISRRIYVDVGAGGTEGAVLGGAAIAVTSAGGNLTAQITLSGAALAQAAAAGVLSTGVTLSADAQSTAAAAGDITTRITLVGAALVTATATGQLTTQIPLAGAAIALAQSTAGLTAQITLAGAALAQAAASAGLTTGGGGLSATASAQANAGATLTTSIRLAGSALAQASASGSLGGQAALAANAAAQAGATGVLTTVIQLSAQAIAQAIAAGALTAQINLAGNAVASVAAGASLTVPLSYIVPAQRTISRVQVTSRIPATQTSRR